MNKTIHFIWLGGKPWPDSVRKCIESWKKYAPEFKIQEWGDRDFHKMEVPNCIKKAYENKKWAFVSDFMRFKILYEFGGLYLDTDVEMMKPVDDVIWHDKESYFYENDKYIQSGVIWSPYKGSLNILSMVNSYFELDDNFSDWESFTSPDVISKFFFGVTGKGNGVLTFGDSYAIYPRDYAAPLYYRFNEKYFSSNTIFIHHWESSWTKKDKYYKLRRWMYYNCFPVLKLLNKIGILNQNYKFFGW